MLLNKNDYGRISSGHIILFGDSQDIISFHCFIVTWVILLYANLLWKDGSYCIVKLHSNLQTQLNFSWME